jgi:hypothetical protein
MGLEAFKAGVLGLAGKSGKVGLQVSSDGEPAHLLAIDQRLRRGRNINQFAWRLHLAEPVSRLTRQRARLSAVP